MSTPFLEVMGLAAGYGKVEAVKGVSLSAGRGSITGLLGPNGAGKTTLMMTVAGLLRPWRGSVRLEGRDLAGQPPHAVVARGIALVPQEKLVFPTLSVRDNLKAGAYRRTDEDGIEADIARLYARLPRLHERRDQKAGALSGGELQMLAMARALMSRPKLLLLDEPSLGLAPLAVEDIYRLIGEISAEGVGILLADQNAPMVLEVARHVHLMEQGRVTFSGDPNRLDRAEIVERACLGRLRPGRLEGGPPMSAPMTAWRHGI